MKHRALSLARSTYLCSFPSLRPLSLHAHGKYLAGEYRPTGTEGTSV